MSYDETLMAQQAPAETVAPKAYDYATFPRQFVAYRWFKPLFVCALTFVFMFVFQFAIAMFALAQPNGYDIISGMGVYESMDVTTPLGALLNLGSLAVMIPSLALALLIVQDRPFSSVSSSRGGWNWKLFGKSLGLAVAISAVFLFAEILLSGEELQIDSSFTIGGFILLTLLGPLQCVAEEYIFRGLLLQTFGSWFKFPAIAIILSAVVFAAGHPYNMIGVITIFCTGIIWGVVAWYTKGLEVTSAAHIANNMISFYLVGLGLTELSSEIDVVGAVYGVAMDVAFALVIVLIGRKFNWFAPTGDGTVKFNEKKRPIYEYKAWVKQQKKLAKQGIYVYQQPDGSYVQQPYPQMQQPYAQPYPPAQPYAQQPYARPYVQQPFEQPYQQQPFEQPRD